MSNSYVQKLYQEFDNIFSRLDESSILNALCEVEDFMGTYLVDTDEAKSLTTDDHDKFYIMVQDGMYVLNKLLVRFRKIKKDKHS